MCKQGPRRAFHLNRNYTIYVHVHAHAYIYSTHTQHTDTYNTNTSKHPLNFHLLHTRPSSSQVCYSCFAAAVPSTNTKGAIHFCDSTAGPRISLVTHIKPVHVHHAIGKLLRWYIPSCISCHGTLKFTCFIFIAENVGVRVCLDVLHVSPLA